MTTKIQILIEFCDEKRFNIEVNSNATIYDIKRQLATKYQIEESQIYLWFRETSFDNNNEKISKYDIANKSTITMKEKIKIKIIFHNENYNFKLFSDNKVSDLIRGISENIDVKKEDIQLLFDNIFLHNDKRLYKYKLRNSTINMITKMTIFVTFGRDKYQMEFLSNAKVTELKHELSEKCKIKSNGIYLQVSNMEMNEEDELGMYGMKSLNISMSRIIQVISKCFDRNYFVEVPLILTVDKLKDRIKKKVGITGNIQISFNGQNLEDNRTILSYEIGDNATIAVISFLKGGINL